MFTQWMPMALWAFALVGHAAPPAPNGSTLPPNWARAFAKADAALKKLSAVEKMGIVSGPGWDKGTCIGNTHPAASINFPDLCLQDGPLGIRYAKNVTAFPPGIQAASTWDKDLIFRRGAAIAEEAKGLGVNVLLGPALGAIGKIPTAGRNWEGFGADPYLQGIATTKSIDGIQSVGVQACAKHYLLNEQELFRTTISSEADDRSLHELYLWPFADAVKANVASVMCSYNKINSTYACENSHILNEVLKKELAYPGYVMSDWGAQHSTVESANGGLDLSMPGSYWGGKDGIYWMDKLQQAVDAGQVPQTRVDDMVRRILASWYLLGQDDGKYPTVDFTRNVQGNHKQVVREVARDGIVLLKNDKGALPLKKNAGNLAVIGLSAIVNPNGINACVDRACNNGSIGMGWGSGTAEYPYFSEPYAAIKEKASGTVTLSGSDDPTQGATVAQSASTAIVFINSLSGEGYLTVEGAEGDRLNLDPWHGGNDLVTAVAKTGKPTIVVVHSVGPIILETILKQPNVVAIVWAGLPGQENGNALVDVLFGATNPSGKLPYTIARNPQDYGTAIVNATADPFTEGLYIDYRHFDRKGIEPRYEFGFGLSYTKFRYTDLSIDKLPSLRSGPATAAKAPGGPADHYDPVAEITVDIENVGSVDGAEVAQLYLKYPTENVPDTPPRQLRGFEKIKLGAGRDRTVKFVLRRKDLSYWDVRTQNWIVPRGVFGVYVGSSSRDVRQKGEFRV